MRANKGEGHKHVKLLNHKETAKVDLHATGQVVEMTKMQEYVGNQESERHPNPAPGSNPLPCYHLVNVGKIILINNPRVLVKQIDMEEHVVEPAEAEVSPVGEAASAGALSRRSELSTARFRDCEGRHVTPKRPVGAKKAPASGNLHRPRGRRLPASKAGTNTHPTFACAYAEAIRWALG